MKKKKDPENGNAKPAPPIRMMAVADLVPYDRNARTHTADQIGKVAASIREFGWTNPILVDPTGGIVAGHARVEAAKLLGLSEVPCIELSGMTKEQRRAYIIADNRLALDAGWDEELLRLELLDLKGVDFNIDLLGFDAAELADITMGPDINQKEYDESAADDVDLITCPKCGQSFPK